MEYLVYPRRLTTPVGSHSPSSWVDLPSLLREEHDGNYSGASIPIWRARSNLAATRVRQKLFLPFGSSPRRSLMVQCAIGSGTSRNTARFTMLLIFLWLCFAMCTQRMILLPVVPSKRSSWIDDSWAKKGRKKKKKKKKIKKKNIVQIQFWNIYSTAYKGGIFEKI